MIGFIGKKEYYLVWNNSVQSAKWKSNDWEESRYWAMQVLSALLKKSESKWLSLSLSCPTCPVASFHISSLPGRPVVEKTLSHATILPLPSLFPSLYSTAPLDSIPQLGILVLILLFVIITKNFDIIVLLVHLVVKMMMMSFIAFNRWKWGWLKWVFVFCCFF